MKACFKCGKQKPITEFYAHPRMRDGQHTRTVDEGQSEIHEFRLTDKGQAEIGEHR